MSYIHKATDKPVIYVNSPVMFKLYNEHLYKYLFLNLCILGSPIIQYNHVKSEYPELDSIVY